jgi:ATP-binding cassette, subfamily B (MDR/TAP), member 1
MLISVGVIGSVIMGAAMPTFAFITGSMIDSFGQEGQVLDDARKNMYYYFGLGGLVLVVGSLSYASWMISGENQAVQCRKEYFKSLLQQ